MKAVDIVRDKAVVTVGVPAGKAFSAIKDRISRLIRRKPQLPVKLPSTEAMPANVSKAVNQAVNQKLAALVTQGVDQGITSKAMQDSVTANNKMFARIANPAFNMTKPVEGDDSVREFQYYSYDARTPDARGKIELQVQDTSRYFLPAEAFIEVEGRLLKSDNTAYGIGDRVGFVNNGVMALFKTAIYMIDGKEIETIHDNIDVVITIIELARYSDDYTRSAGTSMMFAKDLTDHPENRNVTMNAAGDAVASMNENFNLEFATRRSMLNADEEFSCVIPLSHIFGFRRDVRKVIFGAKHTIVLHRKGDDNDAIWRANGVDAGKVTLTK